MSVLAYIETPGGIIKKAGLETLTYARKTAEMLGTDTVALVVGPAGGLDVLGQYGAQRVIQVPYEGAFDSQVFTAIISEVVQHTGCKVMILSHSSSGKSLAGRLAARFDAGNVSGANALPTVSENGLRVRKNVFSGKAVAEYEITSEVKVISVASNSLAPEAVTAATGAAVEVLEVTTPPPRIQVVSRELVTGGTVPLPEAELVVSAGRGLKGPEHWGIIEELASTIGATTACSRPVADAHWRPHHEHVGQTGVAIRPNLYIAVGISGAIQHLAGVSSSKVIVVINKDPEAPFFKAADYGVVGDAFEVVPRLTEAFRKFKAAQ